MPLYSFANHDDSQIVDVFFHMNDEKVFFGPDKKYWRRVYTVPQMNVDTQIDPRDKNQFIRRASKYQDFGSVQDKSRELSEIRAQKDGVDSVKQDYFNKYSKDRKGKPHPKSLPTKIETDRVVVDLSNN